MMLEIGSNAFFNLVPKSVIPVADSPCPQLALTDNKELSYSNVGGKGKWP